MWRRVEEKELERSWVKKKKKGAMGFLKSIGSQRFYSLLRQKLSSEQAEDPRDFIVDPAAQVFRMAVSHATSPFTVGIHRAILLQNFKIPYMEL